MTTLFVIILVVALLLSLYILFRSKLATGRKILLTLNRLLIFTILLLAFFQPSFKITSITSSENIVPALIDLSSSMQLFNADSILSLLSKFYRSPSRDKKQELPEFVFFGFGDSLRPIKDLESLEFNDRNSIFPRFFNERKIKNCRKILLFSDGNWSNTVSQKNILHEKECFYISLQQIAHPSYIHIEAPNLLKSTLKDPIAKVSAVVNGYNSNNDPVFVSCRKGQRIIAEMKLQPDTGFFTETISLPIKVKEAGSSLIEVNARLGDSASNNCYILHDVTPSNFSAYLYSPYPSLDRRFLTLSLNRKTNWEIIKDISGRKEKTDLLILFNWDKGAQRLFNKHKKSSVVFIGCLSCAKTTTHDVSLFTPTISPDFKHFFGTATDSDFPPLYAFTTCRPAPSTIQRMLISYDSIPVKHKSDYSGLPLLFESHFKGRLILTFAAKGIWRWDFWPKSLGNKKDTKFFTDFLIDRMQALIHYNTNQTFYIYPDISPVYETDSLSFKIALPSYLYNFPSVKTDFYITSPHGDTLFDSTFNLMPFQAYSLSLKTPPLHRGKYLYTCSIATERGTIAYSDSIKIYSDNSELRVLGQNTIMLNEIANPVTFSDTASINALFTDNKTKPYKGSETTIRTLKINRSWFMLAFILILLGIEWVLRRAWRLD